MTKKLREIAELVEGYTPPVKKGPVKKGPVSTGKLAVRAKKELEKPSSEPVSFKLSTLRELVMKELEANDGLNAKAVARTLVEKAIEGDAYCMRLLMERVDGLLPKSVSVNGQIAIGQVVTLVDTRSLNVEMPAFVRDASSVTVGVRESQSVMTVRGEGVPPSPLLSSPPIPVEPSLTVEALALEAGVEVLGNACPALVAQADECPHPPAPSPEA
jgi:hypothetical protein